MPLLDDVHPTWARALAPVAPHLAEIETFLDAEAAAGREVLPPRRQIMRAFTRPPDDEDAHVVERAGPNSSSTRPSARCAVRSSDRGVLP